MDKTETPACDETHELSSEGIETLSSGASLVATADLPSKELLSNLILLPENEKFASSLEDVDHNENSETNGEQTEVEVPVVQKVLEDLDYRNNNLEPPEPLECTQASEDSRDEYFSACGSEADSTDPVTEGSNSFGLNYEILMGKGTETDQVIEAPESLEEYEFPRFPSVTALESSVHEEENVSETQANVSVTSDVSHATIENESIGKEIQPTSAPENLSQANPQNQLESNSQGESTPAAQNQAPDAQDGEGTCEKHSGLQSDGYDQAYHSLFNLRRQDPMLPKMCDSCSHSMLNYVAAMQSLLEEMTLDIVTKSNDAPHCSWCVREKLNFLKNETQKTRSPILPEVREVFPGPSYQSQTSEAQEVNREVPFTADHHFNQSSTQTHPASSPLTGGHGGGKGSREQTERQKQEQYSHGGEPSHHGEPPHQQYDHGGEYHQKQQSGHGGEYHQKQQPGHGGEYHQKQQSSHGESHQHDESFYSIPQSPAGSERTDYSDHHSGQYWGGHQPQHQGQHSHQHVQNGHVHHGDVQGQHSVHSPRTDSGNVQHGGQQGDRSSYSGSQSRGEQQSFSGSGGGGGPSESQRHPQEQQITQGGQVKRFLQRSKSMEKINELVNEFIPVPESPKVEAQAYVTMATNDLSAMLCLVLGNSLLFSGTARTLVVLITDGISPACRHLLSSVFHIVQSVRSLGTQGTTKLALLDQPEIGVSYTKLHVWRLTQFSKCVFLDANTMVVQNCDELFDRDELSAVPDIGWPDCFNSNVFVYVPAMETFWDLINFAERQGSYDGGDQGLLNMFFRNWSSDISRKLPFIYNLMANVSYTYKPAFKQFGRDVKIVQFFGTYKPWNVRFHAPTGQMSPAANVHPTFAQFVQYWLELYVKRVLPLFSESLQYHAHAQRYISALDLLQRFPSYITMEPTEALPTPSFRRHPVVVEWKPPPSQPMPPPPASMTFPHTPRTGINDTSKPDNSVQVEEPAPRTESPRPETSFDVGAEPRTSDTTEEKDTEQQPVEDAEKEEEEKADEGPSIPGSKMGDFSGMTAWEEGRADYMGQHRSDNIIARLQYMIGSSDQRT